MLGRIVVLAACAGIGSTAVASAATPSVVPGWPVASGTGSLHAGPGGGGVVVISDGFSGGLEPVPISTVAAFRMTGIRRWLNTTAWGCGNCDDGPQPAERQLDGTYGPIGPDGDGIWAVTAAGARVAGCGGAQLHDGTCISHAVGRPPSVTPGFPVIAAFRGSTVVWRYERPTLSWTIESDFLSPPRFVRDQSGAVYTQLGPGNEPVGTPVPARMIALNETTGVLRSQVDNASPQAAFTAGVVAYRPGTGLARYAPDGTVVWTNFSWTDTNIFWRVRVDEARSRVYVSPRFPNNAPTYVAALDSNTGVEVWRTRIVDGAELLGVGPTGTVYVSVVSGPRFGLRAIAPAGVGRYQWETANRVVAARELPDGTVAVSTESSGFRRDAGLLLRINPARAAVRPRSSAFTLSRTRFATRCGENDCRFDSGVGSVLRIAVPAPAALRVSLLRRDGRRIGDLRADRLSVPAGVTYARLFASKTVGTGPRLVEIRALVRGRTIVRRIPVTIR